MRCFSNTNVCFLLHHRIKACECVHVTEYNIILTTFSGPVPNTKAKTTAVVDGLEWYVLRKYYCFGCDLMSFYFSFNLGGQIDKKSRDLVSHCRGRLWFFLSIRYKKKKHFIRLKLAQLDNCNQSFISLTSFAASLFELDDRL